MEAYETIANVGEGTYGLVYKCMHKNTRVLVAIKTFRDQDDDLKEHDLKIRTRELKMLQKVNHMNIVKLYDVIWHENKLNLVFEFVDHTLLDEIQNSKFGLEEDRAKGILWQVCKALHYLHHQNIIHRDVKPENVLISDTGVVKLCDFGFATYWKPNGILTEYIATRWYRAPELLVAYPRYGKGVDIWALGCLLPEMLTSKPLFAGDSDPDQLYKILKTIPLKKRLTEIFPDSTDGEAIEATFFGKDRRWANIPLPTLRFDAMDFTKRCLQIDPKDRHTIRELMCLPYFVARSWNLKYEKELAVAMSKEWFAHNSLDSYLKKEKEEMNSKRTDSKFMNNKSSSLPDIKLSDLSLTTMKPGFERRTSVHGAAKTSSKTTSVDKPKFKLKNIGTLSEITEQ